MQNETGEIRTSPPFPLGLGARHLKRAKSPGPPVTGLEGALSSLDLKPPALEKTPLLGRGVSVLQGILVLLALLGGAYAAGYFTRDYISRRRRENARIWKNYIDPEWLRQKHGDLGQMLSRWEDRARARRSRSDNAHFCTLL